MLRVSLIYLKIIKKKVKKEKAIKDGEASRWAPDGQFRDRLAPLSTSR